LRASPLRCCGLSLYDCMGVSFDHISHDPLLRAVLDCCCVSVWACYPAPVLSVQVCKRVLSNVSAASQEGMLACIRCRKVFCLLFVPIPSNVDV
jgi:hypothetical protein